MEEVEAVSITGVALEVVSVVLDVCFSFLNLNMFFYLFDDSRMFQN